MAKRQKSSGDGKTTKGGESSRRETPKGKEHRRSSGDGGQKGLDYSDKPPDGGSAKTQGTRPDLDD